MDEMLTARQVADILGVSKTTVFQLHHAGLLRGYRLGTKIYRFTRKQVEDYRQRAEEPQRHGLQKFFK